MSILQYEYSEPNRKNKTFWEVDLFLSSDERGIPPLSPEDRNIHFSEMLYSVQNSNHGQSPKSEHCSV
jgi:hypothetical protein